MYSVFLVMVSNILSNFSLSYLTTFWVELRAGGAPVSGAWALFWKVMCCALVILPSLENTELP